MFQRSLSASIGILFLAGLWENQYPTAFGWVSAAYRTGVGLLFICLVAWVDGGKLIFDAGLGQMGRTGWGIPWLWSMPLDLASELAVAFVWFVCLFRWGELSLCLWLRVLWCLFCLPAWPAGSQRSVYLLWWECGYWLWLGKSGWYLGRVT